MASERGVRTPAPSITATLHISGTSSRTGQSESPPFSAGGMDVDWDAGSRYHSWLWDCAADADGNPHLLFATFPDGPDDWSRHEYWAAD